MSGQRDGVLHRGGSLVQKQFAAASHGFSFRLLKETRMFELDYVVQMLHSEKQRASYAAVAGCTGGSAQGVMGGRVRNHLNSWVVAKKNGCPTGYQHTEIHPACRDQIRENWKNFISCPVELRRWLTAIMQSRNGVQV
jgi:hypothetical protein